MGISQFGGAQKHMACGRPRAILRQIFFAPHQVIYFRASGDHRHH
jgi:hypothetical protein